MTQHTREFSPFSITLYKNLGAPYPKIHPRGIVVIPIRGFNGNSEWGLRLLNQWLLSFPKDIWIILIPNWNTQQAGDLEQIAEMETICKNSVHVWCVPLHLAPRQHRIGFVRQVGHEIATMLVRDFMPYTDLPQMVCDQDLIFQDSWKNVIERFYTMFDLTETWVKINYIRFDYVDPKGTLAPSSPALRLGNMLVRVFTECAKDIIENQPRSKDAQELVFGPSFPHMIYCGYTVRTSIFRASGGFGDNSCHEHFSFLRQIYQLYLDTNPSLSLSPFMWTDVVFTIHSPRAVRALQKGFPPLYQWEVFPFAREDITSRKDSNGNPPTFSPRITLSQAQSFVNLSLRKFLMPYRMHQHLVLQGLANLGLNHKEDYTFTMCRETTSAFNEADLWYAQVTLHTPKILQTLEEWT